MEAPIHSALTRRRIAQRTDPSFGRRIARCAVASVALRGTARLATILMTASLALLAPSRASG